MSNQEFVEIPYQPSKVLTVEDLKAVNRNEVIVKPVVIEPYFNSRLSRWGLRIKFEPEINGKDEVRTISRIFFSKLQQLGLARFENGKLKINKSEILNNYYIKISISNNTQGPPLLIDLVPVSEVKVEVQGNEEQKGERVHHTVPQSIDVEKLKLLVKKLIKVGNKMISYVADVQTRLEFNEIVYELKKVLGIEHGD